MNIDNDLEEIALEYPINDELLSKKDLEIYIYEDFEIKKLMQLLIFIMTVGTIIVFMLFISNIILP
jgi:hypothetical protein